VSTSVERAENEKTIQKVIRQCPTGHYFIGESCPHCGSIVVSKTIEFWDLDCVDCGALCSQIAYCCSSPHPIPISEYKDLYASNVTLTQLKNITG
jgi:hypothetical protein